MLQITHDAPFPRNFFTSFSCNTDNKHDLGLYLDSKIVSIHRDVGNTHLLLCTTQQTFVGLEDVLKACLEDVLKTYLDDLLKILWRQAICLIGISVYLSRDNKSKCVSNKSVFHKSISGNSKANPKCINYW